MASYPFSSSTLACLEAAGWHAGYSYDPARDIAILAEAGYPVHPAVSAFLRRFGGLSVPYSARPDSLAYFSIEDYVLENARADPVELTYGSSRTGESLTPIGEAGSGGIQLRMGISGAVYGLYDQLVWRIGVSGEDAIEALCAGRDWVKLE